MMKKLDSWIFRLVLVYVICLFVCIRSSSASEGFVSIACCADSRYTGPGTNLSYITDYTWFPERTSCSSLTKHEANHTGNERATVFDIIDMGKRCYSLPTIKDKVYLLRGTFPFDNSIPDSSFDVSIAVTSLGSVRPFQDLKIAKGSFKASKNYIDFCLVKEEKKDGNPYILQLKIRLVDEQYLQGLPSSVVELISRDNLGGTGNETRILIRISGRITPQRLAHEVAESKVHINLTSKSLEPRL